MPNQRDKSKKLVGFFASEEEAKALLQAAEAEGLTVADWLRKRIAEAKKRPTRRSAAEGKRT